ncbi:hypothetical protein JCM30760_21780 [Thiomicrorhabdus hydrogeniphila]
MKINKHAYKVVEAFKKSLTKEQKKALGTESLEELQILVEAALGATAENVLHTTTKEVEKLANKMRKKAHSIEQLDR